MGHPDILKPTLAPSHGPCYCDNGAIALFRWPSHGRVASLGHPDILKPTCDTCYCDNGAIALFRSPSHGPRHFEAATRPRSSPPNEAGAIF